MSEPAWRDFVIQHTGANSIANVTQIQSLWSGYGAILRLQLADAPYDSVILKHVSPPEQAAHPRGWHGQRSEARKLRSYDVERAWYQQYSTECDAHCRVPRCLASEQVNGQWFILLEDLDAAGFGLRHDHLSPAQAEHCLRWLAHFHARFLHRTPNGLWPTGCYWHLDTRPDEFEAMADGPMKQAASELDQRLQNAEFQTLVHGDAKVANFCFSPTTNPVAAVDFQYAGGGCGMRDVAYFLGSCLNEQECQHSEQRLLDSYFQDLTHALQWHGYAEQAVAIEAEWRSLYDVAWTDFYRFLLGWMPSHPKTHAYTQQLAARVLARLDI